MGPSATPGRQVVSPMSETVPPGRGWWFDVEWIRCDRCRGTGGHVECYDDICHAQGRCMHDARNNICNLCNGVGEISKELDERWYSRDAFEAVTAPDADLHRQGKLHAAARERHDREADST